jgi:hypothetical protein
MSSKSMGCRCRWFLRVIIFVTEVLQIPGLDVLQLHVGVLHQHERTREPEWYISTSGILLSIQ